MRQSRRMFLGSREGPPNGDHLTKPYVLFRLGKLRHRAMWAKSHFLHTGEMRHLANWRELEQKLFAFEKEAYAVFSPRELAFYALTVRARKWVRTVVTPSLSWWYGNKADRAFELYARENTSDHLRLWYLAETRAARARGVVDWHVGYAGAPAKGEARLSTEAWLLRMTRTTWAKKQPDETL